MREVTSAFEGLAGKQSLSFLFGVNFKSCVLPRAAEQRASSPFFTVKWIVLELLAGVFKGIVLLNYASLI